MFPNKMLKARRPKNLVIYHFSMVGAIKQNTARDGDGRGMVLLLDRMAEKGSPPM